MIASLQYISQGDTPSDHLENIEKACWFGVEWVQLRIKDCDRETVLETAQEARAITDDFNARLIINDSYEIAKEVFADGVHLGQTDACPLVARANLYKHQLIGGTANCLKHYLALIDKKVDYISLGPFRETKTKKNLSPVLGEIGYQLILEERSTEIPIIAIGGVRATDIPLLINYGVYGVAVSSAITKDFNCIETFKELLLQPNNG